MDGSLKKSLIGKIAEKLQPPLCATSVTNLASIEQMYSIQYTKLLLHAEDGQKKHETYVEICTDVAFKSIDRSIHHVSLNLFHSIVLQTFSVHKSIS